MNWKDKLVTKEPEAAPKLQEAAPDSPQPQPIPKERLDLICAAVSGLCARPEAAGFVFSADDIAVKAIRIADSVLGRVVV